MPEGDTIFRSARALSRALVDQPVTGFRSNYPQITRVHEDTPLTGQRITWVEARGKWLLMHFSGGPILVTHMLMSGSWHIYRPGQRWQRPARDMRIVLETRAYHAIGFCVPVAEVHTAASLARHPRIPQSRRDLLDAAFDADAAAAQIALWPGDEIADVLLNQHVMAGVGNEFKSEICFVCGISPFARVAALSAEKVAEIVAVSHRLLRANVMEDSADIMVTYRGGHRRTTHASDPRESVWVYGRAGEPCRRCGTRIEKRLQGKDARVTFWCPACQPVPGAAAHPDLQS